MWGQNERVLPPSENRKVIKVAKQKSTQEIDPAKELVGIIVERICSGEAPAEVIALYKTMEPKLFTYWLHGLCCGYFYSKELRQTTIFQFVKEVREKN
jgi:hypothetical protein